MKDRKYRIIVSAVIFAVAILLHDIPKTASLVLFGAAYGIVGWNVIRKAVRGVINGQMLDENFLMAVASIGAFFVGEYHEAVAVMLFYQVGEAFEDYAVGKSRKNIKELMDIRPDSANLKTVDGIVEVRPSKVKVGDIIIVKPGEKVPLDGIVIEGVSTLNTAALTGESMPRDVKTGDEILSGCVNINGLLTVKVTKRFGESTVNKILDMVENAISKKAKTESFITRFAAVYTPIVVGAAVVLAVVPPLIMDGAEWSDWIYRALNFLVVSCPCALVISVPLSFFGGIGGASKAGVLVKGSNYLEAMAHAKYVVMDKTGTLTEGVFSVQKIVLAGSDDADCGGAAGGLVGGEVAKVESELGGEVGKGGSQQDGEVAKGESELGDTQLGGLQHTTFTAEQILEFAAMAESYSSHPISESVRKSYGKVIDESLISDVEEIAGKGVIATVKGHKVAIGNKQLIAEPRLQSLLGDENKVAVGLQESSKECRESLSQKDETDGGTAVYVAIDEKYAGCILLADKVKTDAKKAVQDLNRIGITTVMLTGDSKVAGERAAAELGIKEVHTGLLPTDKVEIVEALIAKKNYKDRLVFVGDGINDAPVLARADVGIAMGALGSDAAIEAADMVIMNDQPSKIFEMIKISQKTMAIVHQNIVFAIGVKLLVLALSALGIVGLWAAVFADVGVSMIAIINALRCLKIAK